MKISRLATITLVLNIGVSAAAIAAWANAMSGHTVSIIAIAGLLGLVAFSLMWVHFVSDAIRDIWLKDESAGEQYTITRWIILGAILLHPSLIVLYLYQNNYGLPPESYESYLGEAKVPFVFLGILALTVFLAFECKKWLVRHNLWRYILHANFLAMFAVLIHGFQLGNVMAATWYFVLWCLYGLTFVAVAIWWYVRYYRYMNTRKIIAITIVVCLAAAATFAALQVAPKSKETSTNNAATTSESNTPQQSTTPITATELAKNDGKNGAKCWLAIDGTVYDVSNSSEWVDGQHVPSRGMASCGEDLTEVIAQSPHGKSVLGDLPVIGKLE
jgi:predicted heme/steroid binding protein